MAVLELASLSAKSSHPSQHVSEIGKVPRGATSCISHAQCATAFEYESTANDQINCEGLSVPVEFDENADVEKGFYLVYTCDLTGKRDRQIFGIADLGDVTAGRMP